MTDMHIRSLIAAIIFPVFLVGCATVDPPEDTIVPYRCVDLAVIGRIRNLSYEQIEDPKEDTPSRGLIWMRISISKVLTGREHRSVVPARMIDRAYWREDRDFLLVLTKSRQEGYWLSEAALLHSRQKTRLAASCDPTPLPDQPNTHLR